MTDLDPTLIGNQIADILIPIAGAGAIVFAISYGMFFNWRKNAAGQALMYFVLSLSALFVLAVVGRWAGGGYPLDWFIRPTVYAGLSVTVWRLVWVLWRNWGRHDPNPLNIHPRDIPRKPATGPNRVRTH